jgi:hypothetical protein
MMYAGLSGLAAASCDKCMMSPLTLFANYVACFNLLYLQLITTFKYPTSHAFLLRLQPLGPNAVDQYPTPNYLA